MARTRVRFASFLALSAALALVTGCGNSDGDTGSKDGKQSHDAMGRLVRYEQQVSRRRQQLQ
ncbi:hypothetical protein ACWD0G_17650, partial [Streptomyces goshikiensis]